MQNDLHDNQDPVDGSQHDAASEDAEGSQGEQFIFENDVPPEIMQAVENMLRDLDMDDDIHPVSSPLRLLRPPRPGFDDQGEDDQPSSESVDFESVMSNGRTMSHRLTQNVDSEEDEDDDEDDGAVAFGYIPLDQDENMPLGSDDDGDGDGDEITAEDHVAGEVDRNIDEEDSDNGEDAGQGYADYLVDRDGEAIVPTIPAGVMIDTMDAQDPIPEDDLQTIQSIMQSFVLPASAVPDWAKAIPEERWLPRIAARALPGEAAEDASQIFSP